MDKRCDYGRMFQPHETALRRPAEASLYSASLFVHHPRISAKREFCEQRYELTIHPPPDTPQKKNQKTRLG